MKIKNYYFILVSFPFLSFILGYFVVYLFFQKKDIYTPNLIGKNLFSSINLATQRGLSLRLLKELEDCDLAEGTILNQTPKPGQKIRANQSIFLTVSKKPTGFLAPDFLTKDYKFINEYSKKNGINTKIFWLKSFYPINCCIAQYPQENQELENKEIITYFSSGSSVLYVVPNFKDCLISDLQESLARENIKISVFHSNKVSDGHSCSECKVIDQKPMPGSIVDLSKTLFMQLQVI